MGKYTTIFVKLRNSNGKETTGQIVVRDGFALSTFTDPKLAKQLYDYDLAQGDDVAFNEKFNAYIKRYPGATQAKIIKELKEEIKKSGAELIE